jgi:tetratricopeptide (TPR) repeat protein
MKAFLDWRFYFGYGATAEQAEQYELAADLFRKAIAETPEDSPEDAAVTYNYLGYMWLEQGVNTDEAGELIRYALDAFPDNSSYVDSIGWYYFRKGDYRRALAELLRAEQLMANDYDMAFAAALGHGIATEADRDPYEGVDPEVLDHVAQTYAALGEFDNAVAYAERASAQAGATEEMKARLEAYRAQAAGQGAPPAEGAGPGTTPPQGPASAE